MIEEEAIAPLFAQAKATIQQVDPVPPPHSVISPQPVASPAVQPPTEATKRCMYCGEEILAIALKCKHCGELLDPAIRAAEEAKLLALQSRAAPAQPIINVNTSNSLSASARSGGAYPRRSRLSVMGFGFLMMIFGIVISGFSPETGSVMIGLGFLVFVAGIFYFLARLFGG